MVAATVFFTGAAEGVESVRVGAVDSVETYVNIRSAPSPKGAIIGELRRGETLQLLDELNHWFAVRLPDGDTGYVYKDWAQRLDATAAVSPEVTQPVDQPVDQPTPVSARITPADRVSSYVRIRSQPTTDSNVLGNLRSGESLPLINESGQWYAVELGNGSTGYVNRDWTKMIPVAAMADNVPGELPLATTTDAPADTVAIIEDAAAPQPQQPSQTVTEAGREVSVPAPELRSASRRDRRVLAQAKELLAQSRPQEAYDLLLPLELQWGGDAGFDYLYGVAALDSGHAGEAIFSLERVIRSLPDFVGARLDLARALFEVGDRERAQQEFAALLEAEPPEAIRSVIKSYLDALSEPVPEADEPTSLMYAVLSGGYDSNANGAADINEFLGFTLDPTSSEQDTSFAQLQLGALARRALGPNRGLLWRADLKHRHNPQADFVDNSFFNTTLGLGFSLGPNDFITGLAAYWSALDGDFNERSGALDFSWIRPAGNKTFRLTARTGPVRFQSAQSVRDIDRLLYTATIRQAIQGGNGSIDWVLIGGRDDAEQVGSPYSSRRKGARFGIGGKVRRNNLLFDIGLLEIEFGGSGFFGIDRKDEQIAASFSIEFQGRPLLPYLRYVNNDSNVDVFNYDRVEIGLSYRAIR